MHTTAGFYRGLRAGFRGKKMAACPLGENALIY